MTADPYAEVRAAIAGGARLVILIGIPAAGKTTLARDVFTGRGQIVGLDALRGRVSGDPYDQAATADAARMMLMLTQARLGRGLTTVIDAPNTEPRFRRPLLDIAARTQVPAVAVVVDTPLDVCLARNQERPGSLPGKRWGPRAPVRGVHRQHSQLLDGTGGLHDEGFTCVITVRGDHLTEEAMAR